MNVQDLAQRAASHKRAALETLQPVNMQALERRDELTEAKRTHNLKVKSMSEEREVASGHHLDLFPTPEDLAARMVSLCSGYDGVWLEPSAGTGRIAQAIRDIGIEPVCIELSYRAFELLKSRGFNAQQADFLETTIQADVIVMNPPFSKGQDITHVLHAYDCLNPGGRIVAIMSEGTMYRSDKKAKDFQKWLDEIGVYSEKLDPGTFKSSGTMVSARLVIIDKKG